MRILELENPDGTITELIEIEISEGHFIQMLKSTYEAQQAEQLKGQPNV